MPQTTAQYKVLWVDEDPRVLSAAQRLLRGSVFDLEISQSISDAQQRLARQTFALLVVDELFTSGSAIELLAYARKTAETTTRLMMTASHQEDVIREAVNRGGVFRFISKPWDEPQLLRRLDEAIAQNRQTSARQNLLREVKTQNRKLADLTTNLEQIVEERTRSIEDSKIEAEHNSARIRDLVRFVSQLSTLTSVEDLLILIRKELRKLHQVGLPILSSFHYDLRPFVMSFRSSHLVQKQPEHLWSNSLKLRVNDIEDQRYLANIFGRPFQRVIAVPLRRRLGESETGPAPTIFLEHGFADNEIDSFLEFWVERLESLSVALDRLFLESQTRAVSLQWESTFDGIRDPIAIVDVDYRLVRSNSSFESGPGHLACFRAFAGQDKICLGCPIAGAAVANEPRVAQVRRGSHLYSVYSYPIKSRNDLLTTNLINHYVDITESRQLYGQMIQNEKMAAVGLLAGNIAHELNNPLTGIRSLAQILLREVPDIGTLKGDLQEIERASERCETIIRNLLEFSRGGVHPEVVISLSEIVTRTLPMLKTAMRFHRSEILLSDESLLVLVEPQLLQQTVFNLVNNACQAMAEPGTITIETRLERNGPLHRALLFIRDTGEGIQADDLEHIFEPFFTTKSEGQGTGLGLSVSRSIIEQFGGTIKVESVRGQGSTFCISMPLAGGS